MPDVQLLRTKIENLGSMTYWKIHFMLGPQRFLMTFIDDHHKTYRLYRREPRYNPTSCQDVTDDPTSSEAMKAGKQVLIQEVMET